MSALPVAGGAVPTAAATVWTSPNFTCSISLRVVNTSNVPQQFNEYVAGLQRAYLDAVPAQNFMDIEKGLKLPPNTSIGLSAQNANDLYWSITGIQNDGQP